MKTMRRIITLAMAVIMVLSMTTGAFAEIKKEITVEDAVEGEIYHLHKIFDATEEKIETDANGKKYYSYIYTISESNPFYKDLKDFKVNMGTDEDPDEQPAFTFEQPKDDEAWDKTLWTVTINVKAEAFEIFGVNLANYLRTLIENAYYKYPPVQAVQATADEDGKVEVKFTNVNDFGYYFVTTSLGALVALDTNNTDIHIREKNTFPSIEKKVWDDKSGAAGAWEDENSAEINEKVRYQIMVTDGRGTDEQIIVHDYMEDSLTFDPDSVEVFRGTKKWIDDDDHADGGYFVRDLASEDDLTACVIGNTDKKPDYWELLLHPEDEEEEEEEENDDPVAANDEKLADTDWSCTFEVKLSGDLVKTVDESSHGYIVIEFEALLNEDAKIATDHNDNTTLLTYGNYTTEKAEQEHQDAVPGDPDIPEKPYVPGYPEEPVYESPTDTVITKTYMFDIVKTDAEYVFLAGAEFELYREVPDTSEDAKEGDTVKEKVMLKYDEEGMYYYPASAEEIEAEDFESAVIKVGAAKKPAASDTTDDTTDTTGGNAGEGNDVTASAVDEEENDNTDNGNDTTNDGSDASAGADDDVGPGTGIAQIRGLDLGTYYLRETKAPATYNELKEDQKVILWKDSNGEENGKVGGILDYEPWDYGEEDKWDIVTDPSDASKIMDSEGGVHVINKRGTELPATGGMGTTVFYMFGATLCVIAAILLVTKKRMSVIDNK